MRRGILMLITMAMAGALGAVAQAEVIIKTVAWSAPNAFGSPSWNTAASNAVYAMQNGLTSYGTGASQFNAIPDGSSMMISQNIVTGFHSWDGVAAPNTPLYSGEEGNRLTFAFDITSTTPISVSELGFTLVDTDAATSGTENSLSLPSTDFPTFGDVGTYVYSDQLVGINYGPDGTKGTADDYVVNSGANTQSVNELIGRGSGNAWAAYEADPGTTEQDKINNWIAIIGAKGSFTLTGTYYLNDLATGPSGSTTINMISSVPLPSAALGGLVLLGGFGLLAGAKRIRRQEA